MYVKKNDNDVVIVIPTYNSKATIVKVISEALQSTRNAKIMVVDDNSPDKTSDIVNKYFSKDKRIQVIIRKNKGGRGSAVIEGFKEGLKNKNIDFFIEMDSDFAHDPRDIPKLIKKAEEFDVVVASRYLLKSQVVKWKLKRRIISRLANLWIRLMLGFKLTDNTNGFRCYNRYVLESVNFDLILAHGFIVLTEIAYQIYKYGFRFGEIPINFIPVDLNKSNLNIKEVKEAFFTILKLKMNSLSF